MDKTSREQADIDLGAALQRQQAGDLASAAAVYRRVLDQFPDHPTALHYLGLVAQQSGRPDEAIQLLQQSIRGNPADARAYNHLGQVLLGLSRIDEAVSCFRQAIEVDANHVDSLNSLANVLKRRGNLEGAAALYRRAVAIDPRDPRSNYNLASALCLMHAPDEALELFERVIEIDPDYYRGHHNLALLLEQMGRFDEAARHYEAVLRIRPRHVKAMANLIAMPSYPRDQQIVRRAENLLDGPGVTDEDRIKLHVGLGKHYDRVGSHARAFGNFASANSIVSKRKQRFSLPAVTTYFDRIIATFSADLFAARRECGCLSDRPIFIVGMPRSGTTLAEQILSSHPAVFGAGELRLLPGIIGCLGPRYPEVIAEMDGPAVRALGERYLAELEHFAPGGAVRVTDKLPFNFMHLGLIAVLFPRARIVHCRRDPMDVGLSCFMEQFRLEQDFTTDLESFGQYYRQYQRLMAHWRQVLPLPIYDFQYEDLIADQESRSRALLAHCGLEWNDACIDFRTADRAVRTPSRWQVRQPIYKGSVGRWRNYAGHMDTLLRVLRREPAP